MTAPVAPRIRRPSWRDPRLGVGVLLVAGSVALGSWVVNQANQTVEVYAAPDVLTPGETIVVEDLELVSVSVPEVDATYVTPRNPPEPGAVIVRTVHEGEIIPLASVGAAADVDVRTVAVPIGTALADSIGVGSQVDVWVAAGADSLGSAAGEDEVTEPELLVSGVEVAAVHEDSSLFAGPGTMQAHLLVPSGELPAVLAAMSADSAITVVPVPGSGAP
ncbi:hypothetical protein [Ruania halotolerans]|uniref:hypothetical protein n=1 Tax=Ruania halotolerans TaxID=2897773 RepID=UPI001E49ADBF|nr:hypothetical protein [Ruania halotolerans]UFU07604.1 hypothetical protein LQF10_05745 [Ruania halotolerans]